MVSEENSEPVINCPGVAARCRPPALVESYGLDSVRDRMKQNALIRSRRTD